MGHLNGDWNRRMLVVVRITVPGEANNSHMHQVLALKSLVSTRGRYWVTAQRGGKVKVH